VNLSAKTEYACISVLELAASYGSGEPVRIGKIAETHGIPPRFLVQILLQLKGAGLVTSTRGASGGYELIRNPAEITLGEVMGVIEGPPGPLRTNTGRVTAISRVLLAALNEVSAAEREMLSNITFAELAEQSKGAVEGMYYI
jgi:Rrf2 family protein